MEATDNIHYDIGHNEIHLDDIIIFPVSLGGSPYLNFGKVIKINPKTITVQRMQNSKRIYTESNNGYTVRCTPYFGDTHVIRNPNRSLIIDISAIPEEYVFLVNSGKTVPS